MNAITTKIEELKKGKMETKDLFLLINLQILLNIKGISSNEAFKNKRKIKLIQRELSNIR